MSHEAPDVALTRAAQRQSSVLKVLRRCAIIVAVMLGAGASSCAPRPALITVAWSPFEGNGLLYVAESLGYFGQNGIDVTMRRYDSGVAALDGVLNGEADIAVGTSEFPLVAQAFQKARIRTLAVIARSDFIYLVARKDRGIEKPQDLKGKTIGATARTISEFHLGRFLELHGVSMQDITLVDLHTPADWVEAPARGDVDAVTTAQPYARAAAERLGLDAIVWPAQSGQPVYSQAIAGDEWIAGHPEAIQRFLKALAMAQQYLFSHPAEARSIVQKQLGVDGSYMDIVWTQNQFGLSLDQSLIVAMEDEARWMIKNGRTEATTVPDFLDYVAEDGLRKLDPGVVSIIR
jgi:ABC-type nitrate/sulfonate/bicarbonate transport system substrate-binding protein